MMDTWPPPIKLTSRNLTLGKMRLISKIKTVYVLYAFYIYEFEVIIVILNVVVVTVACSHFLHDHESSFR
jgi:hypothetical protein